MTKAMKEFTAAKMLTAAIKAAMGELYDNDRTCVSNVTSLMMREKQVDSGFKSQKEDTMPRLPRNNAPKKTKNKSAPKKQKVAKVTAKKKKKTA